MQLAPIERECPAPKSTRRPVCALLGSIGAAGLFGANVSFGRCHSDIGHSPPGQYCPYRRRNRPMRPRNLGGPSEARSVTVAVFTGVGMPFARQKKAAEDRIETRGASDLHVPEGRGGSRGALRLPTDQHALTGSRAREIMAEPDSLPG